MKDENIVAPLRNELIDMCFRQEEIISDLMDLVNSTDKNEKVLEALQNCLKSLQVQEDSYKNLFVELEKAAYIQAVHHFNL